MEESSDHTIRGWKVSEELFQMRILYVQCEITQVACISFQIKKVKETSDKLKQIRPGKPMGISKKDI